MGITIRRADLKTDRQTMMDVLLRNRERYEDDARFADRFDWLYQKNPYGTAAAWLAIDDARNEPVGFTSAFPRRMTVLNREVLAWNCADFSIDKAFRTLGVALKLRRAAKTGVDDGEVPFLYAHPNDRMRVIHEKVGHHPIGAMKRFAAPLRIDNLIAKKLPVPALASGIAIVGNPLLRLLTPQPRKRDPNLRTNHLQEAAFGEEFDQLYARVSSCFSVSGFRDAVYLNWRYRDNPLHEYELFTIHRDAGLAGYAVFHVANCTGHIADILCEPGDPALEHLLGELFTHLRKRGIATASIKMHEANAMLPRLQEFGFRERDDATSTVISYAPADTELADTVTRPENWFMTVGDRDV